ncbi:MAG: hypothetical protein B6245_08690 [Desulfobacteraceae bacterium 4572_88]|nr:MAG: hypothetical protein B6245_08690 [Desulfobacteraceae bacterium 4572_88]
MVLRQLANILSANIRAEDIICRYGGEEFLIVIPDADSESVCMMAERLRFKVENAGFTFADHKIPVTVSLGVSLHPDPGTDTVEKMVPAADKALYHAKETGRNRVVVLFSGIRDR